MNKLKKSLSVLLTLVMLFTIISTGISAFAASVTMTTDDVHKVVIGVPETIYMTPNGGASQSGQYFVNNKVESNGNVTLDAESAQTLGSIGVYAPGSTAISFNVTAVTGGIGDPVLGGSSTDANSSYESQRWDHSTISGAYGTGATQDWFRFDMLNLFVNGTGLTPGKTALIEWAVTVYYGANDTTGVTYYAYTTLYSPHRSVGAVSESRRTGTYNNEISSWITGINGIGGKDNWSPISSGNGDKTTQGIFKYDPLWTGLQGGSSESTDDYVTASTTEYYVEAKAPDGNDWTRAIGYIGYITVDSSRYTNTNQIPNFKIGSDALRVQDSKKDSLGRYYAWYILGDSSKTIGTGEDATPSGWTQFVNKSEPQATSRNPLVPAFDVSSINGQYIHVASQAYCTYLSSKNYANAYVSAQFTTVNKADLRKLVLEGSSLNSKNYTEASWNAYKTELRNAALALGNPSNSSIDTSNLTAKRNALQTNVYFNGNGGNVSTSSAVATIGVNATATFNASAYTASRTGYTFKGWATSSTATSGSTGNVTVGFNQTLYAVWKANTYNVTFDNLVDLEAWKKLTPGNATVSDVTDNGFTLTSKDGVGEGTFSSPFFPVEPGKSYTIDLDTSAGAWDVYIFFCDANGGWIDFADGPTNRFSNSTNWGSTFTAPNKTEVVKAQIRVDANGSNSSVRFENIRVYEVGTVADGVSYVPTVQVTYDSAYGNLPTPTKTGYVFKGWVDENGNAVSSSDKVQITDTQRLYSTWEIGKYTITFDTDGGSAVNPITGNYGTAVTAPANPTKTGYTFAGWDREIPGTIPAENITIKAKWNVNQYTITFDTDGGSAVAPITQNYGTAVTAPTAPTKEGYTFAGWENLPVTMPAGNMTVKAKWTINQYTITFDTDGGSAITPITQDYGTAVTAPSAPTKEGYTFAGWDREIPGTIPAENITIKAKWNVNSYTITFDTDGGSAVAPITQNYGTAVTAPAAPTKEGYTFAGWSVEVPGTMPAENITIKAKWNINQYTITFNSDGGSAVSPITQDYNTTVTAPTAPTKEGYTFAGWENLPATMPAENITVKAIWTVNQYTITFNSNGGSAVAPITQDFGTAVTAPTAPTMTGYTFVSWYPALPEAMPAENITLTAQWTINLYDVTFKFFDKDGTEIIVERTDVPHGTAFSALQLPTETEGFINTYYNGAVIAPEENTRHYVFSAWENTVENITEDVTFTAVYTEKTHDYFENGSQNATCTQTGIEAKACDCGYSYSKVTLVLGHDWKETGRTENCTTAGTVDYKCSRCSETKQESIPAVGHDASGEWKVTTPATCTEKGIESHYCARCGEVYETRDIDALGHKFSDIVAETAPSCTEVGYKAYKTCTVCKLYFDSEADVYSTEGTAELSAFEISAAGHKTVLVEAVAPKCEEDGNIEYYTCENCDLLFADAEGKTIITSEDTVDPAKGHDYEAVVTAPTCTEKGYTTYTCKNDSEHTYVDNYVDATGHDYTDEWVETKAPDCTNAGIETLYCAVCKVEIDSRKVEALGHDYEEVVTPPNCTDKGYTTYTCHCGVTYVADYVDALGHTEAKKQEVIKEATCTVAGDYWDITYCSVCNIELDKVQVTGQTLPHTYTEQIIDEAHLKEAATCVKYAVYYYDCAYCTANAKNDAENPATFEYVDGGYNADNHIGSTTTDDEDFVAGTCVKESTWNEVTRCADCNAIITSVPKKGDKDENNHVGETEVKKENVVAGTCTSVETWNDVTYCLDCEKAINTEAKSGEKNPANHSTTETVLKDNKAATCCEKGYTGDLHCADCDAIVTYGKEITENKDNHTGGTRVEKENVVPGTCVAPEAWNDVTYCLGCGDKLGTVARTGEIDEENHTGETRIEKINEAAGTCAAAATWIEVTYCADCGEEISRENKTGEKDAANHTGETYIEKINEAAGTCETAATWTEVIYCKGCDVELDREDKTGETDPENHTGETYIKAENIVPGTCVSVKTWDEVTYCSGCDAKLGTVTKTGDKDENNHTGTADKVVGYIAPTCKTEGYTGDTHYSCCDKLYEVGTAIPTVAHTEGTPVRENEIPATETEDGSYESVVYCTVCGEELSREKVALRLERTITFIMKDKTVEVKAFNGDTVSLPDVADFTGTNGFIHKFKSWDKAVTVVNGDATYTAIYTEPADWSDLDALEEVLNDVLEGGLADDGVLEANKAKIEEVLKQIETINKERNTLDKSEQGRVDFVVGNIGDLIDIIYPDAGSTIVIEGSSIAYVGTILDLKAVKMPLGTVLNDATWVSSDDSIVFFSNGKLYAIGTGTVTLTVTRGVLQASKVVTIIEGGNVRGINFTSINNTHFIIEDYASVYNSSVIYWSDDTDLRFRIRVYQSFMFDDYIVYINGVEAKENAEGYYVIPAGSGDAKVTVAGIMEDDDTGNGEVVTKWSFWEWLLSIFRKIADFFKGLFS